MKIGFTGTQQGMTDAQKDRVIKYLNSNEKAQEFHHGDCIGADAQACAIADDLNLHIVCHPPLIADKRAFTKYHEIREPLDYLARNKAIVHETELILATPKEHNEVIRSGTWSTIRYARKIGRPLIVIFPDGSERGYL